MKKGQKIYIQKCCMFIGVSLFLISLPFWMIESPLWCGYVGFALSMSGFILVCITLVHEIIFGGIWD